MTDLQIESLSFGGRGVGRMDGKAVFVPYVAPGETVRCRIVKDHKRYSEAELLEVLDPSPQRITPECPVFAECGGCQWQHLADPAQLEWKERIFRESLQRAMPLDDALFAPIVASPGQWNYRCRARLRCRMTRNGFVAGFYRAGSHFVVDIEHCPLLAPELNDLFGRLKKNLADFAFAHRVPQIDLCADDHGRTSIVVHYLESETALLAEQLAPLAAEMNCSVSVQPVGRGQVFELFAGETLSIQPLADDPLALQFPPGSFTQVNLEQNRQLVAAVTAHASSGANILDLYCGIGNFSLPMAQIAASVVGIEDYIPAIEAAKANAELNQVTNATFMAASAEKGLSRQWGDRGFDTVVLDPPRAGADEVVKQLARLQPEKIVYVSCDPMTLARDLKSLLERGYRPDSFRPYDMFPQTWHIEGVAVLVRQ